MGGIYQLTFFLALTLLALVIAIFVLAVSLLGRAIESAAESERVKIDERKRTNAKEMAKLQEDLDKAKEKGEIPDELIQKLDILKRNDKKFEEELNKIRKAPEALTVKRGAFYPASLLIMSLILCGVAWFLSNMQGLYWIWSFIPWILGLVAIGYSACIICKSLKVIQDVAVTSEEAWTAKIVQAFKIAQKELDEEKRPEVALKFRGVQPPFEMVANSETELEAHINLTKGDYIQGVEVHFGLPIGFEFIGEMKKYTTDEAHNFPKYNFFVREEPTLISGMTYWHKLKIKAPETVGSYKFMYCILGRGLVAKTKEFDLIVK